ncbi:MAG: nuclear transport factor 2 family protein [Anaeromyxobacteraceae bacterium]
MRSSGSLDLRALGGLAAVVLALALAAWLARGGAATLHERLESPETAIRRALAATPGEDVSGARADGGLRLERLRFIDPVVRADGARAEVVAVADAYGTVKWRGLPVRLTYLGRERFTMVRCQGAGWCTQGPRLPRLAALLAVLSRRADALDGGDADVYRELIADDYRGADGGKPALLRRLAADLGAAPRARFVPIAWQVRIERETAQVGEDYEIGVGVGPLRRLRARLDLREDGGRWRITGGL